MRMKPLDYMAFKNGILQEWVKEAKYNYDIEKLEIVRQIYMDKKQDPLTFRDKCSTSKYTGITATAPKIPYMEIQDDSKETFINNGENIENGKKQESKETFINRSVRRGGA